MKHVVVDLEMNRIAKDFKEERKTWKRETIEIGAVVLDEAFQEIGSFKTLVKPEYNDKIESYYEKLTGITTERVDSAPVFCDALRQFFSWLHNLQDDLCLYQWSQNDLIQIKREMELKKITLSDQDQRLLDDWKDLQQEYGKKLGFDRSLSLKDAVMYSGIDFDGREHTALDDARNTAHLLDILRNPKKCKDHLGQVIAALNPTSTGNSIGSMIDFSSFYIA